MTKPQISHFLIDAGNVYLLADHGISTRMLRNFFPNCSDECLENIVHGPAEELFATGQISPREYFESVFQKLGYSKSSKYKALRSPPISFEDFKEAHNSHIYLVCSKFMSTLSDIESKYGNENIAIVTQTHVWQTEREHLLLHSKGYKIMERRFKGRVFRSHVMGKSKKTPEFWEEVFAETKYLPEKTLLVDDNRENIEAMLKFNNTAQYHKYDQKRPFKFSEFMKSR